jgi:hypothetical protein
LQYISANGTNGFKEWEVQQWQKAQVFFPLSARRVLNPKPIFAQRYYYLYQVKWGQ